MAKNQPNKASIHTVTRYLNEELQATKTKILEAATAIIVEQGHEALQIKQLSELAGLSRLTIYRYFPTREHIIIDTVNTWAWSLASQLTQPFTAGETLGVRLRELIRRLVQLAANNKNMIRAIFSSIVSSDPASTSLQTSLRDMMPYTMNIAVGNLASEAVVRNAATIFGHLLLGNFILLCSDNTTCDASVEEICTSMRLIIGDLWNSRVI